MIAGFLRVVVTPLLTLSLVGAGVATALGFFGAWWFPLDAFATFRLQFALVAAALSMLLFALGRWRAAAAGAVVVAIAGVSVAPAALNSVDPADAQTLTTASPPLRIAMANILFANPTPEAAIDDLLAADADIVIALEVTEGFLRRAERLDAAYPHRVTPLAPERFFFVAVWSRTPLRAASAGGGRGATPLHARASLEAPAAVEVIGLHMSWPILGRQERELDALAAFLGPRDGARIVIGDFNAAPWGDAVARVERAAGVRRVGGLTLTWTRMRPFLVTGLIGLPLDHAFVSDGVFVSNHRSFVVRGSDHLGLVLDIRAAE